MLFEILEKNFIKQSHGERFFFSLSLFLLRRTHSFAILNITTMTECKAILFFHIFIWAHHVSNRKKFEPIIFFSISAYEHNKFNAVSIGVRDVSLTFNWGYFVFAKAAFFESFFDSKILPRFFYVYFAFQQISLLWVGIRMQINSLHRIKQLIAFPTISAYCWFCSNKFKMGWNYYQKWETLFSLNLIWMKKNVQFFLNHFLFYFRLFRVVFHQQLATHTLKPGAVTLQYGFLSFFFVDSMF